MNGHEQEKEMRAEFDKKVDELLKLPQEEVIRISPDPEVCRREASEISKVFKILAQPEIERVFQQHVGFPKQAEEEIKKIVAELLKGYQLGFEQPFQANENPPRAVQELAMNNLPIKEKEKRGGRPESIKEEELSPEERNRIALALKGLAAHRLGLPKSHWELSRGLEYLKKSSELSGENLRQVLNERVFDYTFNSAKRRGLPDADVDIRREYHEFI